jgi:D-alanyl-D-alanine carboxypeptidase (penicillin-binding protein 5/6)
VGSRFGSRTMDRARRGHVSLLLVLSVVCTMVLGPAPVAVATVSDVPPLPLFGAFAGAPPQVSAQSWILYDDTFGEVLAEESADLARPMASTTKIMTALVALENGNLDQPITITQDAVDVGEAEVGLVAGETLTLRQLLTAMLVRSGNDTAVAIAQGIGGTVAAFVQMMNDKAREMGLENTHFANPHGLDEDGHYTSARDLLEMARAAMADPVFATAVRTQTVRLPDTPDGTLRVVRTTNMLLSSYPGAIGVKTGYTGLAGHVLVAAAEREGRRLYAVVMGSTDAFTDATALLDYGFAEFGVIPVIMGGVTYAQRRVAAEADSLQAGSTVEAFTSLQEPVTLDAGFEQSTPVVTARVGGEAVGASELVGSDVQALPTLKDALGWIKTYWSWLWGR